ncbi:hypothetical protein ULMS_14720 [Patiriisocius marinistellae]|uniref:Pirin family protein n=1 Tax=Patiriisocius marinistellae TaxID=2494560 RepID=A0A5J4FXT0_9FLAO|nr:pirin family protein [Patiriisocius marinistellae]GEQ85964.1 hypothetical protein ULMS_14720 [Patiriisocius marinistellae]
MKTILHPASTRGIANFGWLDARYSFSFANFYDPNRLQFGALRVLNDDIIAPSMGFGEHPHKNMEIITIPQSGILKHKDSMGNEGIVKAGDIQVMSAGSGIEHSEINAKDNEELSLFQLWIFSNEQNVTPRYDQKKIQPLLKTNRLTAIVKPRDKALDGEVWIHQDAYIHLGNFNKKTTTTFSLNSKAHGAYVYIINGNAEINNIKLNKRDAMGIWDVDLIEISVEKDSDLMLIEVPMN